MSGFGYTYTILASSFSSLIVLGFSWDLLTIREMQNNASVVLQVQIFQHLSGSVTVQLHTNNCHCFSNKRANILKNLRLAKATRAGLWCVFSTKGVYFQHEHQRCASVQFSTHSTLKMFKYLLPILKFLLLSAEVVTIKPVLNLSPSFQLVHSQPSSLINKLTLTLAFH